MMADSCEPLAVSWQLKVLNDGGWQDVILSDSEGSIIVVRKAVRRHSEWKETKGCRLFIRSQRRGAFPELRVKLFA